MRHAALRRGLLRWYATAGRDLPWRRTRDPYAVLVSEVMLQQTPVARVIPTYAAFLERFPTLAALAIAPLGDVLRSWGRLGYPRRARDLRRAAQQACGALPGTRAALDALPGVGRYTAGAVACFAFAQPEAFADTNIARVLGRIERGRPITPREAERIDAALLPPRRAPQWHHALMDLGATICTARAPKCGACPVRRLCVARSRGAVAPAAPRRQAPFATSDRRIRGEIVAALRLARAGLDTVALRRSIADDRVPELLAALISEGLVERAGRRVRLPT